MALDLDNPQRLIYDKKERKPLNKLDKSKYVFWSFFKEKSLYKDSNNSKIFYTVVLPKAQSAGAIEYADCISAEGKTSFHERFSWI